MTPATPRLTDAEQAPGRSHLQYLAKRARSALPHGGLVSADIGNKLLAAIDDRDATIAALRAENARLLDAEATAERRGWEAGRDAASLVLWDVGVGCSDNDDARKTLRSAEQQVAALTPPSANQGIA